MRWCSCRLAVTRWVSHVEQELLTLPDHMSSPPVFSGLSDYSFGIFKLFFIHSLKSCIHAEDRWWVLGTIVWRKFCRSNLQHVKVWNDKFTIYLPTSCGFQMLFIFSFLFKPCSYEVAENQYLYFKKLLHNYLIW